MTEKIDVCEQLDLVTLKRKVAIPVLGALEAKTVMVNVLIGNLIRPDADTVVFYAYRGVEQGKDGQTTPWETGSLKQDLFTAERSGEADPKTDWEAVRRQQWSKANRNPQKITLRADNVDSETTGDRKGLNRGPGSVDRDWAGAPGEADWPLPGIERNRETNLKNASQAVEHGYTGLLPPHG